MVFFVAASGGLGPETLRGNSFKKASEILRKERSKSHNSGRKPQNFSKCFTLLEKLPFFKKASDFLKKPYITHITKPQFY
jgi:hypothetical protein